MKPLDFIVDGILAVIVIILFPVMYYAYKQDSITTTLVHSNVVSLTDDIRSKGYLDKKMYDNFLSELYKTGLSYDISLEHRKTVNEPKYRLRTEDEVINGQNGAYTGGNEYHYHDVITEVPTVNDPINTGSMNTETNESILGHTVNKPADPDHVHSAECYVGDYSQLLTASGIYGWSEFQGHTQYDLTISEYSSGRPLLHCTYDFSNTGYAWQFFTMTVYQYDNISDSVSSKSFYFNNYISGNIGDAPSDYYNVHNSLINLWNSCGLYQTYWYHSEGFLDSDTGLYSSYPFTLPSTLKFCIGGTYGNLSYMNWTGDTYCSTKVCDKGATSIVATHPDQTVYIGDPIITTVTATYMDGSAKVIVCDATGFDKTKLGTQMVTLIYSGLINDGKASGTKTCNIVVNVVPRTKICPNGHTYNLNPDGSDPGCPYCKAWLKSLAIKTPETGSLTIYRGTTLQQNGVTLLATFFDGNTEILTEGYIDNLDKMYVGDQNVTIGYKGLNVTLKVAIKRNLVKCSICKRYYDLYPDDTDPGCPYCTAGTPVFSGEVMKYCSKTYEDDIVTELYTGKGIYYFMKDDYFTITVENTSRSIGGCFTAALFKGYTEGNIRTGYGGYIRQSGQ